MLASALITLSHARCLLQWNVSRLRAGTLSVADALIPGGIPAISEVSADENGFKIGVKC